MSEYGIQMPVMCSIGKHENNARRLTKRYSKRYVDESWPSLDWSEISLAEDYGLSTERLKAIVAATIAETWAYRQQSTPILTDDMVDSTCWTQHRQLCSISNFSYAANSITESWLSNFIESLQGHQRLNLSSCKLESLDFLKDVSTISWLDLSHTPITDDTHLKSLFNRV